MTATKYALVPVVATEEMRIAGITDVDSTRSYNPDRNYTAMLAAAPKELPEEVVEKAARAVFTETVLSGHDVQWDDAPKSMRKHCTEFARAALLAVMGVER